MLENEVIFTQKDGVRMIKFNRPAKKNAMNRNIYETITRVLNEDAENDKISVTIITGVGDYYSSGNDMVEAINNVGGEDAKERRLSVVRNMVNAFIHYPKLLIAVVNGPAIGIAATTAALCDIVYASEKAYFHTPFIKLGLCAEAASSFTFPLIMGRSKASEMLLLGQKMTAQEAYQFNFVSKVVPHEEINNLINSLRKHGQISAEGLKINKNLITSPLKKQLLDSSAAEIDELYKCFDSDDFSNAIAQFMSKISKL